MKVVLSNILVPLVLLLWTLACLAAIWRTAGGDRARFGTLLWRDLSVGLRAALVGLLLVGSYTMFYRSAKQWREAEQTHDITRQAIDIEHYHEASVGIARGGVPWRDFKFEYPPAAAYLVSPPAWGHPNINRRMYTERYVMYIGGILMLGTVLMGLLWGKIVPVARLVVVLGLWSFFMQSMGELTFLRMEPIIALLTVFGLTALFWTQDPDRAGGERPQPNGTFAFGLAGLFLGLATAKLYPILLVLAVLGIVARRKMWLPFGAAFVVGLLPSIIPAVLGPDGLRNFLGYHTDRHFEVGSLYSMLFQRASDGRIGYGFGSVEWRFGAEKLVGKLATMLTLGATFAPLAWTLIKARDPRSILLGATTTLAGFVLFNKVGSPQYATWLLSTVICGALFLRPWRWWHLAVAASFLFMAVAGQQLRHFRFDEDLGLTFGVLTLKVISEVLLFAVLLVTLFSLGRRQNNPESSANGTAL